jgi:hypothetical protein
MTNILKPLGRFEFKHTSDEKVKELINRSAVLVLDWEK